MIKPGAFTSSKLPGTRIKGRGIIASTGTNSLDSIFGGGVSSSSLIFIDEIETRKFFLPIGRCFLAEGITSGQTTVLAAVNDDEVDLLNDLPALSEGGDPQTDSFSTNSKSDFDDPEFRIAWRYSTLPKVESSVQSNKTSRAKFDLSKKLDVDLNQLKQDEIFIHLTLSDYPTYAELWSQLHKILIKEEFLAEGSGPKKFLRILLPSLTSALWTDPENIVSFLIHLKAFCRKVNCLVLIGIDSSLLFENQLKQLLRIADAFIRLEYIDKDEQKSMNLHQTFDGRLYILKLPTIVSAASHRPDCLDLVFSLKRTYFDVKIFHLPPALENEEVAKQPKTMCQRIENEF